MLGTFMESKAKAAFSSHGVPTLATRAALRSLLSAAVALALLAVGHSALPRCAAARAGALRGGQRVQRILFLQGFKARRPLTPAALAADCRTVLWTTRRSSG